MDKVWKVTFDGSVDSYWVCDRDVVTTYVDSQPSEEGRGRNSLDGNGRWKIKEIKTFTSIDEKSSFDHVQLLQSAFAKLTKDEIRALAIDSIKPDEDDPVL